MPLKPQSNYAFIDSQNLQMAIKGLGWSLDYRRFRIYLLEKYGVQKAFLCIGYVPHRQNYYDALQRMGYTCVFKPTLKYRDGTIKGNCDAELVLQTMIELSNFEKCVIISGDGDFYCLVQHLLSQNKLEKLLIPDQKRYSALLRRFPSEYLAFVCDLEMTLKRKEPREDGTSKGALRGVIKPD